jgi:hypothetical protein
MFGGSFPKAAFSALQVNRWQYFVEAFLQAAQELAVELVQLLTYRRYVLKLPNWQNLEGDFPE